MREITNFNYIILVILIPFVFIILTIISHYIFPPLAKIFVYATFGSFWLIVVSFFLVLIFFSKTVKSIRRSEERATLLKKEHYFFDLINEARKYGWLHQEESRTKVTIQGNINSTNFTIYASYEYELGRKYRHREERISIVFDIKNSPTFYLTQGNLPGLLGEKIIKIPNFKLNGVTPIGEDDPRVQEFIIESKSNIEFLFKEKGYLSDLVFENNIMEAIILSDTNEKGETEIYRIVSILFEIARSFNAIF